MSIIQKLENSYVTILRVVVIIAATLLLVGAAVFGIVSLKNLLFKGADEVQMAAVDPKDVLAEVVQRKDRPADDEAEQAAVPNQPETNPYQAHYDKIYKVVGDFVSRTSKKTESVRKEQLFSFLDERLEKLDEDEVRAEYIEGLAAAFQTSLGDKRILARIENTSAPKAHRTVANVPRPAAEPAPTQFDADGNAIEVATDEAEPASEPEPVAEQLPYKESPFVVINEVVDAYEKLFSQKVAAVNAERVKAEAEKLEARASATMQITVAAGLFGAFLLVIFLTIAIRIERNLRDMVEARAAG